MLFLAAVASVAMAQSQKVISGVSSFRATLPEFSYDGKAQIFTTEKSDQGTVQKITFYSNDFTKQGELTINQEEYEYNYKSEERAWVDGKYTGDWQVVNEGKDKHYSDMISLDLEDFDQSCNDFRQIYISQTIFNSDDKYEYLMPVISIVNDSFEEDRDGDGVIDYRGSGTTPKMTGIKVVSESGEVLQTINFPDGFTSSPSKGDDLMKINNKLYLRIGGNANGSNAVLICSIGTAASGGDRTRGDVNGDGVVSGADVTALYNNLLDETPVNGDPDVNGDGVVSGADVTALYGILMEAE